MAASLFQVPLRSVSTASTTLQLLPNLPTIARPASWEPPVESLTYKTEAPCLSGGSVAKARSIEAWIPESAIDLTMNV